ncbi:MAG: hypothetical protein AB1489_32425, partial [Acidobacteriota bacterium]
KFSELKSWTIVSAIIGILAGIAINFLSISMKSLKGNIPLLLLGLAKSIIIALTITGLSIAFWYYSHLDYTRLKDTGPLALLLGLTIALWELLSRITQNITKRAG